MRKPALVLLLALASCGRASGSPPSAPPRPPPAAVNPDPGVRAYRCEDGRTLEAGYPDREIAVIDTGEHSYTLAAQPAASGVRYVGFGLQWWTKGRDEARLARLKPGETIASDPGVLCRAAPDGVRPTRP